MRGDFHGDEIKDYITELNQNYNDLGEDILLLEAVILARDGETEFPEELVRTSLWRLRDYIRQHTEDIETLSHYLSAPPEDSVQRVPFTRTCKKSRGRRVLIGNG